MTTHRVHGDGTEPPVTLWAASLYGAKTRRGLVELSKQDEQGSSRIAQMSPAEARAFALAILEAAEAAEMDQLVMVWMRTRMKAPDESAVQVLADFRKLRDQWREAQEGTG